jgi:hypothetical protein
MSRVIESVNEDAGSGKSYSRAAATNEGQVFLPANRQTNKELSHMKPTIHVINAVLVIGALALVGQAPAFASVNKAMLKQSSLKTASTSTQVVGAGGMEVITAAAGGEAISAETAGGTWTTLTGPVITETYARDTGGPGLGTIVLNVPAGFEFNPAVQVTVRVDGDGHKTINGVADGGTIPAIVTQTSITITITSVSRGGLAFPDTLTFQNIQVRPTAANVLASGNITESGTCEFRDLTLCSGTWGTLHEVGGAVPNVILADPLGDWDGDGRSNLMEYALGTDPTNPTDNAQGMQVWIMDDSGNKYLALGFKERTAAGLGLQYLPEVSGDKQTWYSDNTHVLGVSVSPVDTQFNWVIVRDTVPLTPTSPRFIRLTVLDN